MTGTDIGLHVADLYARTIYELAEQFEVVEELKGEMELLETLIAEERGVSAYYVIAAVFRRI